MQVTILAKYDTEANVWFTLGSSLKGLIIEADSYEQFVREAKWGIEILLDRQEDVNLIVKTKHREQFKLNER